VELDGCWLCSSIEVFLKERLVEADDEADAMTLDGVGSALGLDIGTIEDDREGAFSVGWYGGGTESSNSAESETATSTIEPKSSKSKEARRRLGSVGRFLPSALASNHGCPMISTSFFDLERDLETDILSLSIDCFASLCPFNSLGRGAGIRYPSLVNASIWRC
jgi:hypothetical protein